MSKSDARLIERCAILSKTIIEIAPLYLNEAATQNQKQFLETVIGAAIWYLPQSKELWTGMISVSALKSHHPSSGEPKPRLTADHLYPRKVAAMDLLRLDWSTTSEPTRLMHDLYIGKYGVFSYITPNENSRLVGFQKTGTFIDPDTSYRSAGIKLLKIDNTSLRMIRKRDASMIDEILNSAT